MRPSRIATFLAAITFTELIGCAEHESIEPASGDEIASSAGGPLALERVHQIGSRADYFGDFVPYDPGPNDPYHRAHGFLTFGDFLYSPGRAFRVGLQTDGNLVLYTEDAQGNYVKPLWGSNTVGSNAHSWVMQGDGNLVIYNGLQGTGSAVWGSGTQGNPGAFLRMQDDGNLVIYNSQGAPIWATNTAAGPR